MLMSGSLWISFVTTKAIIAAAPGPASMLVVSHGLASGVGGMGGSRSRWAAMGIVLANAFYFVLAATGLGAMLSISSEAFVVLRWTAAVVLVWMGVRAFWRSSMTPETDERVSRSAWQSCWTGALLQLANPNALLFFVAILPQFVDPHRPLLPQVGILGVTGLALDVVVLTLYAALASRLGDFASASRVRVLANRLAGVLLVITGVFTIVAH